MIRTYLQVLLCCFVWAGVAKAEAVRNGNELARDYSLTNAMGKAAFQKERTGLIHTFRFLAIHSITRPSATNRAVRLMTSEPSSDMRVEVVTDAKLSLQLSETLQVGDAVAVRGRVKSVATTAPDLIVVDPGILQFKDKAQPKAGKELLKEVDHRAN